MHLGTGFTAMPADNNTENGTHCQSPPEKVYTDAFYQAQVQAMMCIPPRISEPIQVQARRIFLQDTIVLTPSSSAVSPGHFANLAGLLNLFPGQGPLRAAVDAVALTSLATRFGVPKARSLALAQYNSSIRFIRAQIIASTHSAECLVASICLLSIYEILNADMIDNLNCVMHLRGIMAIMRTQVDRRHQPASPVELLVLSTDVHYHRLLHTSPDPVTGIRNSSNIETESPSSLRRPSQPVMLQFNKLALIFPKVTSLFKKAAVALQPKSVRFETQLRPLRLEAFAVRSELLAWSSAQPAEIRPMTIRRFTQPYTLLFPDRRELRCPTLRADSFPDYLVANMWTSYYQCQLHVTNLICRLDISLSESLKGPGTTREMAKLRRELECLIDDVFASIPFMLAGEDVRHSRPEGSTWRLFRPAMLLGGWSMQWILFVVAILQNAPVASKQHARDILSWFGETLGIGQAKVLANMYENPPGGITAKGDALRWSGFLM